MQVEALREDDHLFDTIQAAAAGARHDGANVWRCYCNFLARGMTVDSTALIQAVPTMSSPMPAPSRAIEPYAHSHHQSPVPRPASKALLGRP